MAFTLCLNTSTIGPQPLLEKIRLAGEAGFEAIELWLNDIYQFVGQGGEVRDVEKALADHGLTVPCTIAARGWGDARGPEYQIMLDDVKRRMEMAARLGAPYLVATPPRFACDLEQLAARYVDLLEIGRKVGVRPTFEYISFCESVSQLSQAWRIVRESDRDDATLVVDAFHTYNSGSTLEDLKAIPAEKISHYHIDDASPDIPLTQQTDPDRVMPGEGIIDLAAEIEVLKQIGYTGAISLELFNRQLWSQDPREVLAVGIRRLRELVE